MKGVTTTTMRSPPVEQVNKKLCKLKNPLKVNAWRSHKSIYHTERGQLLGKMSRKCYVEINECQEKLAEVNTDAL